ncbi:MAG: DNA polymerase III subunit alpha, partial [Anaerovoracaceae bacterium]
IDIDFCYERRQEVIDYVIEKYGEDHVAQISTFGTMKAKAAVRDVGRALNVPYADTDVIAKAIPFELGITIDRALKQNPALLKMYNENIQVKKVIDTAKSLEGLSRHSSTHAAGVVISKEPIQEYVPLISTDKGVATQFSMTVIEAIKLLKMDFLGLRNLTIIQEALAQIKANHNVDINFSKMDYDDPKVYELIASGNTQGVFQLESGGMTAFMQNLQPDCFEDVVAGISLFRPGPMASIPTYIENKNNPEKIEYLHESLRPILEVTYGCLVYQEQVMQIVRELAGYSYGRSDFMRRAMSKKKMTEMLKEKDYFINGLKNAAGEYEIEGCIRNGVPLEAAEQIFNKMVSFAEYAFNKSHAAAYAVLSYQTGYLKVYYPKEFMAALMSSVMGDSAHISSYIRNCLEMGIEVLPADINKSGKKFSVVDGKIRFGLSGVKNVGDNVVDAIIEMRERVITADQTETRKAKPIKDIFEFVDKIEVQKINKKAVESLIKAGAFDSLNSNRAQYLTVYEALIDSAQKTINRNIDGQISLFTGEVPSSQITDISNKLPDVRPFSKEINSGMEKEMLGVYLTEHPLEDYQLVIDKLTTVTAKDLAPTKALDADEDETERDMAVSNIDLQDGEAVKVAGIVVGKRNLTTKNNKQMAFVQIEDLTGLIEIVVFPNVFERVSELLDTDSKILVSGTVNFKDNEAPKVLANRILDLQKVLYDETHNKLKIRIPETVNVDAAMIVIKEKLADNLGDTPVLIYLPSKEVIKAEKNLWVEPNLDLLNYLENFLGKENVKLST